MKRNAVFVDRAACCRRAEFAYAMLSVIAAVPAFVGASDGDTLTVRELATGATTVLRLAEVVASERSQPYSQVSRRNLELCRGKPVEFQQVGRCRPRRPHSRARCLRWRQCDLAPVGRRSCLMLHALLTAAWKVFAARACRQGGKEGTLARGESAGPVGNLRASAAGANRSPATRRSRFDGALGLTPPIGRAASHKSAENCHAPGRV